MASSPFCRYTVLETAANPKKKNKMMRSPYEHHCKATVSKKMIKLSKPSKVLSSLTSVSVQSLCCQRKGGSAERSKRSAPFYN